jgi:hypothetical protein
MNGRIRRFHAPERFKREISKRRGKKKEKKKDREKIKETFRIKYFFSPLPISLVLIRNIWTWQSEQQQRRGEHT